LNGTGVLRKTRFNHTNAVQQNERETIPIGGKLLWATREQAGHFNLRARQLRSTPPTHRTLSAAPRKREGDTPIDAALIRAEVLVPERYEDDGEEGERKDEARGYVPLLEDDAGILDLGVPAMRWGKLVRRRWLQDRTHQSMCIEQVGPMSPPSWPPCPPWP